MSLLPLSGPFDLPLTQSSHLSCPPPPFPSCLHSTSAGLRWHHQSVPPPGPPSALAQSWAPSPMSLLVSGSGFPCHLEASWGNQSLG